MSGTSSSTSSSSSSSPSPSPSSMVSAPASTAQISTSTSAGPDMCPRCNENMTGEAATAVHQCKPIKVVLRHAKSILSQDECGTLAAELDEATEATIIKCVDYVRDSTNSKANIKAYLIRKFNLKGDGSRGATTSSTTSSGQLHHHHDPQHHQHIQNCALPFAPAILSTRV